MWNENDFPYLQFHHITPCADDSEAGWRKNEKYVIIKTTEKKWKIFPIFCNFHYDEKHFPFSSFFHHSLISLKNLMKVLTRVNRYRYVWTFPQTTTRRVQSMMYICFSFSTHIAPTSSSFNHPPITTLESDVKCFIHEFLLLYISNSEKLFIPYVLLEHL